MFWPESRSGIMAPLEMALVQAPTAENLHRCVYAAFPFPGGRILCRFFFALLFVKEALTMNNFK
jgi:hypothetical protein